MTRQLDASTLDRAGRAAIAGALAQARLPGTAFQASVRIDRRNLCVNAVHAPADGPSDYLDAAARRAATRGRRLLPVVDAGQLKDCFWIAYDRGSTSPLAEYRKHLLLPTSTCLRLLADVARALDDAADDGVFPYEVGPESVFASRRGARLGDLGTAREALGGIGSPSDTAYVPPEVRRGEPAGERSGVYIFGALLYHFLAGASPRPGHARANGQGDGIVPLADWRPDLPVAMDTIVGAAMADEPHRRPRSAGDAYDLARRAIRGDGPTSGAGPQRPGPRPGVTAPRTRLPSESKRRHGRPDHAESPEVGVKFTWSDIAPPPTEPEADRPARRPEPTRPPEPRPAPKTDSPGKAEAATPSSKPPAPPRANPNEATAKRPTPKRSMPTREAPAAGTRTPPAPPAADTSSAPSPKPAAADTPSAPTPKPVAAELPSSAPTKARRAKRATSESPAAKSSSRTTTPRVPRSEPASATPKPRKREAPAAKPASPSPEPASTTRAARESTPQSSSPQPAAAKPAARTEEPPSAGAKPSPKPPKPARTKLSSRLRARISAAPTTQAPEFGDTKRSTRAQEPAPATQSNRAHTPAPAKPSTRRSKGASAKSPTRRRKPTSAKPVAPRRRREATQPAASSRRVRSAPSSSRSRQRLQVVALGGAVALGTATGLLLGGSPEPEPARAKVVNAAGMGVTLPPGWEAVGPGSAGMLAVRAQGDPGSRLEARLVDERLERQESAEPVQLGTLQAWRSAAPGTLRYSAPTTAGTLFITCQASPTADAGLLRLCERTVTTLKLRTASPLPLAGVVEEEDRLQATIAALRASRDEGRRRLARAIRSSGQREVADALARSHERSARALAELSGAEPIEAAVREAGTAYSALAKAAETGAMARWNRAREQVRHRDATLAEVLAARG
jgi:hypothetical protein